MTHDTTQYEGTNKTDQHTAPPLCLIHYFAERDGGPPPRKPWPPGRTARIAERRGNLIILEFADPPAAPVALPPPPPQWQGGTSGKSRLMRACDILLALLMLACFAACLAAFRF